MCRIALRSPACSTMRRARSAGSTFWSTMPASPVRPAKVEEMHPEDWDRCITICLTGQFNCTRLAVPLLRKSKNASIVNLSSAAGKFGFAMRTPYAAAKWGVIGFTKSLSIEIGTGEYPRQRHLAGSGRRRPAAPRARSEGAAARHLLRRDGEDRFLVSPRSRTT